MTLYLLPISTVEEIPDDWLEIIVSAANADWRNKPKLKTDAEQLSPVMACVIIRAFLTVVPRLALLCPQVRHEEEIPDKWLGIIVSVANDDWRNKAMLKTDPEQLTPVMACVIIRAFLTVMPGLALFGSPIRDEEIAEE